MQYAGAAAIGALVALVLVAKLRRRRRPFQIDIQVHVKRGDDDDRPVR